MRLTTRVGLLAGASALVLTGASFADNSTTTQDQDARIAELETQLARLTGDNWLTDQRAESIRGLVQDVLADADTRASLLSSGLQGGYDGGFMLGSADGAFSMKINGHLQSRFIYNNQDDLASSDTSRVGFENTRTRLIFSGNVGGDGWSYYVDGGFMRGGGGFALRDASVNYDAGNGWDVTMGQFKVPLSHEWMVDSMHQLAVERSIVNNSYNGGRTQGLMVHYADDQMQFWGSFNDGASSPNGVWSGEDTEWAFTARGEYLFSGNWGQFHDFTSPMGSEQGVMAGAGVHYQTAEYGTVTPGEAETLIFTADVSAEFDGSNLSAAFHYLDIDGVGSNPLGFVVQGGYYFADDMEGFIRYEYNDFDVPGADDLGIITVGVNAYYTANVKMTADIGFGVEAVPFNSANDIAGYRTDGGTPAEDGQIVFRTQLQLTF